MTAHPRHDVPRLPGVRVHVVRARRTDDPDESVRLVVLHAHRLPRRARHGRRALAAHAARDRLSSAGSDPRTRSRRHLPRCTGTSSTSSGSRSSRSSTSSSRADDGDTIQRSRTRHPDSRRARRWATMHEHPTWKQYKWVALILTLITVVEVWIYYIPPFVASRALRAGAADHVGGEVRDRRAVLHAPQVRPQAVPGAVHGPAHHRDRRRSSRCMFLFGKFSRGGAPY